RGPCETLCGVIDRGSWKSVRGRWVEPAFNCPGGDLSPGCESKFVENMLHVGFCSPRGHHQVGGDIAVGQPPRHECCDLALSVREETYARIRTRLLPTSAAVCARLGVIRMRQRRPAFR